MNKLMIPLLAVAATVGCSSGATRTVAGQLDLAQLHPVNAQVIAISSTGRVFRAPVAASGAFSIALPTSARYTIRFANATNVANRYDAFATLAPLRAGTTTHWFSMTPGATIALGRVAPAGTSARSASALTTASDGSDSSGGTDSADSAGSEQEDDSAEACDLSGGQDDADVESDHDLNQDVDSDHDGTPDATDTHDDRATCPTASSGDDCSLSDDEAKELDDDANQSCTTGGGGGSGGTVPTPAPGVVK